MINLDRATDRRRRMEEQFSSYGFEVTRLPAIDAKADPSRVSGLADEACFYANMGRKPLLAEIGCYASHLEAWRCLIASGAEVGLIMEDDVVFHADFAEAVRVACDRRDAWDFLKLNCIRAKLPVRQSQLGPWRLNAYLGPATGFGAYLITAELARRLLPAMLPMTMPIDYEGSRFFKHDFRLLGLEPFPSHVDDGGVSTITGVNFAEVQKVPRLQRLGNYQMRAANYFRRFFWLLRRGMLNSRSGPVRS